MVVGVVLSEVSAAVNVHSVNSLVWSRDWMGCKRPKTERRFGLLPARPDYGGKGSVTVGYRDLLFHLTMFFDMLRAQFYLYMQYK